MSDNKTTDAVHELMLAVDVINKAIHELTTLHAHNILSVKFTSLEATDSLFKHTIEIKKKLQQVEHELASVDFDNKEYRHFKSTREAFKEVDQNS